jgi:protein-arginine kinase activator protein McsA
MNDEPTQQSEHACQVCGRPAEIHTTYIEEGDVFVRHECFECTLHPDLPPDMKADALKRRRGDK